ncbi:sensor histidine kinase [Pseudomonadota bacterium]
MRGNISKNRLRLILGGFFVALSVPTAILINQAFSQMKWETFRQHQIQAEELAQRIDNQLAQLIQKEEARSFTEYSFLNIAGDAKANFLQRSPLAEFPIKNDTPGLIGYFQVDNRGDFTTPLLPTTASQAYGINNEEREQRLNVQKEIQHILSRNQLVTERKPLPSQAKEKQKALKDLRDDEESDGDILAGRYSSNAPSSNTASLRSLNPTDSNVSIDINAGVIALEDADVAFEVEEGASVSGMASQQAFDQLKKSDELRREQKMLKGSLGRVDELQIEAAMEKNMLQDAPMRQKAEAESIARTFAVEESSSIGQKRLRKEQAYLPEPVVANSPIQEERLANIQESIRITTFESEIDPFSFDLLNSGHFVLHRKVWRNGQRYTQGLLFNQQAFLKGIIESTFKSTALYGMSNLVVAYQGEVFSVFSGQEYRSLYASASELRGELLYQTRLSNPIAEMQLIFSVTQLPIGAGANVIIWTTLVITLVLLGGFLLIYRLGTKQIALARQQQDFVSSVSHELKTPLTSIRMYGEMLREGWATEDKKKTYYNYIHDESERLSRLINNVLQLARMTRNDLQLNIKPVTAGELIDTIRSKISSQLERTGFELNFEYSKADEEAVINADPDAFAQIIINLVDNAVKFSSKAEKKQIDICCKSLSNQSLEFSVRDYGPGIDKNQMKKIFKLFYRTENELTRETIGTGIGLALVNQLTTSMKGKVDVVNRAPGAEFRIVFKA